MNNSFSKFAIWAVIAMVLFTVFRQLDAPTAPTDAVTYSQFLEDAKQGKLSRVEIQVDTLTVTP